MKVKDLISILQTTDPNIDVVITGHRPVEDITAEQGYLFFKDNSSRICTEDEYLFVKDVKKQTCTEDGKKWLINKMEDDLNKNINDYSESKIQREKNAIKEFEDNMKKVFLIITN